MAVLELLKRKGGTVFTVPAGSDVATAVHLFVKHGIGGLPVLDASGALVGFIGEREVVSAMDRDPGGILDLHVDQVMRRPAPTCRLGDPLQDVMVRMTRERVRHFTVLDGGRIAGVISVGDLVKHRLEQLETEAGVLRDYVAAQRASR